MFYKSRISLLTYPLDRSSLKGQADGISGAVSIKADSRVEAFLAIYDLYTQQGDEVTVLAVSSEQKSHPLRFSDSELSQIKERGVDIKTGFYESEVQIESLEENPLP